MSDVTLAEDSAPAPVLATLRRGLIMIPELRVGAGLTIALSLVGALGRLVVPYLIARAIDDGFDRASSKVDLGLLAWLTFFGVIAACSATAASQVAHYRLGVTAERALAALRLRAIDRILDLSVQQHTQQRRGILVARVTTDVESLSQFFSWGALSWLLGGATLVVVGVAMVAVEWKLALVTFALSIPLLLVVRMLQRRLQSAYDEVRTHISAYLGQVSELIGSAALVRAYGAHTHLGANTRQSIVARRQAAIRAGRISALMFISAEAFLVAATTLTIALGLRLGSDGGLSAGTLVGFTFLVGRFLEPIAELTEVTDQTQLAAAGLSRVLDLLDLEAQVIAPAVAIPLPSGPLSVVLRDVTYRYPPRPDELEGFAITDVNLAVKAGEHLAIVGATGSGKSTLAKLIVRTADPTEGSVEIGDVGLVDIDPTELRTRVQLVAQEPFLFSTTIGNNVRLAMPSLSDTDLQDLFDDVGLGPWIADLDNGWETMVGERGGLLSAGERQLVGLARARAANPDVLVLDEATSSVDASTEARLADTIDALATGRTTIVIAHRLTTVERADRVVVLEGGRVVEVGAPSQLRLQNGHYARLAEAWDRSHS